MRVGETIRHKINQNFIRFAQKRMPMVDAIELNQSKIFIVPTRQGLVLLLVAVLVVLMAINFESPLNYALGFWLISILWVAVYLTYRNLSGLAIERLSGNLVCVEDFAEVSLKLSSAKSTHRGVIEIIHEQWGVVHVPMYGKEAVVSIPLQAHTRGPVVLPRFRIESRYPFGLIVAWSYIHISATAWAYPAPMKISRSQVKSDEGDDDSHVDDHFFQAGSEDFHSLKPYQEGDSIRRMYWPGFSRDLYLVKSFSDYQSADIHINWDSFPGVPDELRLAAIAHYSQAFARKEIPFGLILPNTQLAPDKGHEHLSRVRRLLAEYGHEQ